ncbi:MAG: haloacid dehalogenase [Dehalococcoidia bacterium]|nr:MAG: haloacid dehalogenase [Dehalococcoidia bacterium]
MTRPTSKLDSIGEKVCSYFSTEDSARETGLRLSRESIRFSANAIRAVHRGEYDQARELINSSRANVEEMSRTLAQHGELLHGGFVRNAQKEYAEACITLALVSGQTLPDPDELSISYAAYLNGLGEAAGELRRHLLDTLREGRIDRCEEILEAMDDIYSLLVTIDFHDALTGGLRRTTDMVRGVLERTRGDFTISLRQKELEQKLEDFGDKLNKE